MPSDRDDPSLTHPNVSALTTTNASASRIPVRNRVAAMIENAPASATEDSLFQSYKSPPSSQDSSSSRQTTKASQNDSSDSSSSSELPPILSVAPASTAPRAAGKVVIITGANSPLGIGRAAAHLFAANGAKAIYITDADDEHLQAHKKELNTKYPNVTIHPVQLDVTDEDSVKAICEDAINQHGRLDVMFANAGTSGGVSPFTEIDADEYMHIMKINALGVFLCFKYAAIAMKVTSESSGKSSSSGSLIGTASVAGIRSNAGGTAYSASKAAVINMAQTFAYQLVGTNIRANAICPGLIETGMTSLVFEMARKKGTQGKIGQLNPMRRAAIADEVARVALFLGSDESSYVNGQAWAVCGGLSAGLPFVPGKLA